MRIRRKKNEHLQGLHFFFFILLSICKFSSQSSPTHSSGGGFPFLPPPPNSLNPCHGKSAQFVLTSVHPVPAGLDYHHDTVTGPALVFPGLLAAAFECRHVCSFTLFVLFFS